GDVRARAAVGPGAHLAPHRGGADAAARPAPELAPPCLPATARQRGIREPSVQLLSVAELLGEDALIQAVAGIEHHEEVDLARLLDLDAHHEARLGVVGDRTHGALVGLQNVEADL